MAIWELYYKELEYETMSNKVIKEVIIMSKTNYGVIHELGDYSSFKETSDEEDQKIREQLEEERKRDQKVLNENSSK